jgi:hypothetical protein
MIRSFCSRRPAPPPRRSGDQFNPPIVVRHKHVLEDIPKPSAMPGVRSNRWQSQARLALLAVGKMPRLSGPTCPAAARLMIRSRNDNPVREPITLWLRAVTSLIGAALARLREVLEYASRNLHLPAPGTGERAVRLAKLAKWEGGLGYPPHAKDRRTKIPSGQRFRCVACVAHDSGSGG